MAEIVLELKPLKKWWSVFISIHSLFRMPGKKTNHQANIVLQLKLGKLSQTPLSSFASFTQNCCIYCTFGPIRKPIYTPISITS